MTFDSQRKILVNERNRRVKGRIQEWQIRPDKTFCVSAKDYRINTGGYRLRLVDQLPIDVARSEIKDLKQHIGGWPAKRMQQDLTGYITNTLPSLLNSLEIWVLQGTGTCNSILPAGIDEQLEVRHRTRACVTC
jgi:hypothetical protein